MHAIVYTASLTVELRDEPEPTPGPDEVLVEVSAVGICGSELEGFRSRSPFRVPPLIMGHEFEGRLPDGTRVAINPLIACGTCDLCRRGARNLCRHRQILGIHRPGAFAERVAVPTACCVAVPDDVPEGLGALAEPIANAVHAWRLALAGDQSPARVGVIGAGTLGLAAALVAQRGGVRDVTIVDLSAERVATALEAGVTHGAESLEGEFDLVFDAVGSRDTRALSVERLRPGGTAMWIGLHDEQPGFDSLAFIRSEKRVLSTFAYLEHDFAAALEMVAELGAPSWVTRRPLVEGVEAFLGLLAAPSAAAKTLLAAA